jgi:type I restriction enzyme S subunit
MKVAFPSTIEEQQKIVDFLDYKTGECDRFISNRQKQIELLNEQKVTIINKAVTKGINPTAKMKPSGIEWIGDIPENWKVSKVKFVATVKGRIGFRGYTVDDLVDEGKGALTLGATQINKEGEIDLAKSVFISWDKYYESPEIIVQEGDILVVQRGSTIGASGIVSSNIGCATINPSLTILKRVKMNRYLLFLQLRSKIVKEAITTIFNETAIPMLSQNQISNFNVLLPPNEEDQQSIIDFIKQETLKIETLISKYQKQIELMKEYRTALISQAVTGKIDVRDWKPQTK